MLIDTNVLLLLVVGRHDADLIPRLPRTSVYTPDDFTLLELLIAEIPTVKTTPHVLTETSNLLGHLGEPLKTELFEGALRPITAIADELYRPSRELAEHLAFPKLGLTDTAVLALARQVLILTDDLKLSSFLFSEGADFINFHHLRRWA